MAITIDFLSNVRGLLKGTDDVEEAFEDVASSLDDLARDSQKAGDKLGDNIGDGAKDAEKGVDRLERTFKDLADTAKRETKGAGDQIGRNYKKGTDEAGEGLKEFKDEANSTARESAASFDGSAESIADVFQEVAANAFAGFGPAGAVAGLAAAVGIGMAVSAIQGGIESTEALKERTQELADEYITTGGIGATSIEFLVDKLKELATESADGSVNLAKLDDVARRSGSSFEDLAQAYGGNVEELKKLWREGDKHRQQLEDETDAIDTTTSAGAKQYAQKIKQSDAQREYMAYLGQTLGVAAAAAEAEKLYAQAGGPELERKAQLVETVNAAYDEAAGAASDYINAESGLFDTGAYITAMQAKQDALRDYQTTLAESPLTAEAKSFLDSQGVEAAAQFLAGYKSATPEQQAALNAIWTEAGSTSSGAYTGALKAGIPTAIDGPLVTARGDASGALAEMQRQIDNNPLVARVKTKFDRVGVPNI